MIESGRPSGRAIATISGVIRAPVAPVQVITMSAWPSSAVRSLSGAVRAPYSVARRSALPAVRLTTVTLAAPIRKHRGGGQPGHGPGPDDDHALALDVGAGGTGAGERGGDQRRGGAVDVGLGARALPDAQRLLEERVEGRPDRAELLAQAQRLAGLAEDLALADRHRVEAGGDVEEVRDGAVVVVDVEVRQDRADRLAGSVDQHPGDVLDAAVEAVHVGVDLQPVAGGDDRHLGDVLAGGGLVDQLVHAAAVEGDLLQQGHRR